MAYAYNHKQHDDESTGKQQAHPFQECLVRIGEDELDNLGIIRADGKVFRLDGHEGRSFPCSDFMEDFSGTRIHDINVILIAQFVLEQKFGGDGIKVMQRHRVAHFGQTLIKICHRWNGVIGRATQYFCSFRCSAESYVPFFFQGFFDGCITFLLNVAPDQFI